MKFSAGIALLGFTFISAICGQTPRGDEPDPPQRTNLMKIISDPVIWSNNFLPAIAQAEALEQAGERFIELFPRKILSGEKFNKEDKKNSDDKLRSYDQAQTDADKFELYQKMSKSFGFAKQSGKTISYLSDEIDSLVVGIDYKDGFLFKPDTKMEMVFKQFGKPEKTDSRAIHGRGEERPEILTLYSYENGIIMFAESDNAAEPGLLNRVFIDVPRFVRALKSEMK
jgi:hypothetical protein